MSWSRIPRIRCGPFPQSLALCNICRRVVGDYGGDYGEECNCGKKDRKSSSAKNKKSTGDKV